MRGIVTAEDIMQIHGLTEDRTFEIKQYPPLTQDLIKHIQGFINGTEAGGHIILGMGENKYKKADANKFFPIKYPLTIRNGGAKFESFDGYRRHIIEKLRHHTKKYHEEMINIKEILISGGSLIVIEMKQSHNRPHFNLDGEIYMRGEGKTYSLDSDEVVEQIELRVKRKSDQKKENEITEDEKPWPFKDGQILTSINGTKFNERGQPKREVSDIVWKEEPYAFIHFRIEKNPKNYSSRQLNQLVRDGNLLPFGFEAVRDIERNKYGVISLIRASNNTTSVFTQVFHNGEIFGVNSIILNKTSEKARNFIPTGALEKRYENAIKNILLFYKNNLQAELPLIVTVGLKHIEGYKLAVPGDIFEPFVGEIFTKEITEAFTIDDYKISASELLRPFFTKIWEEAGEERPKNFRDSS